MAALKLILYAALLCCLVCFANGDQQCVPLQGSPVEACTAAGYNTTYPMPTDIKLSEQAKGQIHLFTTFLIRSMENCSLASMGESVYCSFFAPYCRPKDSGPFLPCQRVCSEFLKRCDGTINQYWLEYYIGTCSILPNSTADTGKCYEPPEFNKHYNYTTKGLLEGSCNRMLIPMCKDNGYNYTTLSTKTQLMMYRIFYGKNFTNTSEDDVIPPKSIVNGWMELFANYSKCATNMKKMWCGDLFPPCFPEEGFALYTLCQPFCHQIGLECPGIMSTNYANYITSCEMMAYGNTSHGYCKHTTWPPPMRWVKWFKDYGTPAPPTSKPAPAVQPYVIAIAVIVPIILVALIVMSIIAWRQRSLPTICLRGQDKEKIVE